MNRSALALKLALAGTLFTLPAGAEPTEEPIGDAKACQAKKGRWITTGRLRGCLIKGRRNGWWTVWDEAPGTEPVLRARAVMVDGELEGPSSDYHENGALSAEGEYRNGKKVGPWRAFHPGGQPRLEVTHDDAGEKHGHEMHWHANCVQALDAHWDHGKKTGHWVKRLPNNNKLEEGDYSADQRTGTWTFWHKKGPKLETGPYVDGLRHGTWTEFTFEGHRWRSVEYLEGARQTDVAKACAALGGEYDVDFEAREDGCRLEGRRVGLWTGSRPDGTVEWTTHFKDGREEGTHTDFHPGGEILRQGEYARGAPTGTHIFRSADGKTEFGRATVTDGNGEWVTYWPTGGLREQGTYADHRKHGVWQSWHANGNPEQAREWKAGRWDGETRAWFTTGELKHTGYYRDGRRFGRWVAYFTNGRIAWEGVYDGKGDRVEAWKEGFWEGGPRAEGLFTADERSGQWVEWHNNGKKKGVGPYQDGKREGEWTEWWYSGEPWRTVHYSKGVSVDPAEQTCGAVKGDWRVDPEQRVVGCNICRVDTDDDGELTITKLEQGEWRWWHPNGELEAVGEYRRGQKDGRWERFFDDGRPMMKGEWRADVKHGEWQGYYRSGNLRFSGGYRDGKEHGEWTTFHENGRPHAKGEYAAGEKTGPWVWTDATGAKQQEGSFVKGQEDGVWRTYHANGQKKSEGKFAAGERVGAWAWWRADGSAWRSAQYEKGREVR